MITRDDFSEFFMAVNGGNRPFGWQSRLLDHVLDTGSWPSLINAPTGAGKSNVVDVHVFANALFAVGEGPRIQRRLAVVVNRRALVDQHIVRASLIKEELDEPKHDVTRSVAEALSDLNGGSSSPIQVVSLRGGVALTSDWIEDPRVCAVIAATPDMWGSRLLFRGYGSSPHAWPREAGLLGLDSVVILDEAHLSRQMELTAQRVSTMAAPQASAVGVPGLAVVSTTATPGPFNTAHRSPDATIGVDSEDLVPDGRDELLRQRLLVPKDVFYHPSDAWPTRGRASAAYISELVDLTVEARSEVGDGKPPRPKTVACIVNSVDSAARVADELRSRVADPDAVVLWVGRLRPLDLDRERLKRPGIFTIEGDATVEYLVATQTVEVGIDLDLAAMVTELAPGSALAQRFGRVDRLGSRGDSRITVVGPASDEIDDRPPYLGSDLKTAREWISQLEKVPDGASPWSLAGELPPPEATARRFHYSQIQPTDVWQLTGTSNRQFADQDLTFWLRDDLEPDNEPVSFVVRSPLPDDDASAQALIAATPPAPREYYPCTIAVARECLDVIAASDEQSRAILVRDDLISVLRDSELKSRIRPGDVFVVDPGHAITVSGVFVGAGGSIESDLETVWGDDDGIQVLFRDNRDSAGLFNALAEAEPDDAVEIAAALTESNMQVVFPPEAFKDDKGIPPWIVLIPQEIVIDDPELRQEWSTARQAVLLETHSDAVAKRARLLAEDVGLAESLVGALETAGRLHDAGKADIRFQVGRLGGDGKTLLAKSGTRSAQTTKRRAAEAALPRGWRHEQLSAAITYANLAEDPQRDLATRLVGTSHGRGRPFFPHGSASLVDDVEDHQVAEAIRALFEAGLGWSAVLESTESNYGAWGCAYLEALIRAADCAVSKEGS